MCKRMENIIPVGLFHPFYHELSSDAIKSWD